MTDDNNDQAPERLIRLEEKHDHMYKLTEQIADTADSTSKALNELVLIHKETRVRLDNDRESLHALYERVEDLSEDHQKLKYTVWRCIFIGTGIGMVLSYVWYAGLLPNLIGAG